LDEAKERTISRVMRDLEHLQARRRREHSLPWLSDSLLAEDRLRTVAAPAWKEVGEATDNQITIRQSKGDSIEDGAARKVRAVSMIPE
jgi:hypothetical protein